MKTKSGKTFQILSSEWNDGWLMVNYQIGCYFKQYRFLYYSKKEACKKLRAMARAGELD